MKKILLVIFLIFFNSPVSYSEELTYEELTYMDGSKYIGQTKNKQRHGQGTYFYSNGSKYVGEWKNNLRHGQGTYTDVKKKYIGEYKNDKLFKGTVTLKEGITYFGEFKNNLPDGLGIATYLDGKKESGRFSKGDFIKREDTSVLNVSEIINLNKCFFKDKQKDFDETKLEHFTFQVNNLKKIVTVDIILTNQELKNNRNTKGDIKKKTTVVYNIDSKKNEIIKALTIRDKEIEKLEINLDTLEVIQGKVKVICSN